MNFDLPKTNGDSKDQASSKESQLLAGLTGSVVDSVDRRLEAWDDESSYVSSDSLVEAIVEAFNEAASEKGVESTLDAESSGLTVEEHNEAMVNAYEGYRVGQIKHNGVIVAKYRAPIDGAGMDVEWNNSGLQKFIETNLRT